MNFKIVMLGMVGAGKGTQAKKLGDYLNIPHISTGDIFRDAVKRETELGVKASRIMKEGGLVPDEIVLAIVKERVGLQDADRGYILDGFPRTLNQAVEWDNIEAPDIVFYIDVSQEEVVRRLKGRRVCEDCNGQYNIYLDKHTGEVCTECEGELIKREDDEEDTVMVRIKNYFEQTKPLIEYYQEKDLLIEINGEQYINEIFESIKTKLENSSFLKK
ncbi:adenylate kinase [Elusimicrobiota bacterium]